MQGAGKPAPTRDPIYFDMVLQGYLKISSIFSLR
jgi:hypothetical protein